MSNKTNTSKEKSYTKEEMQKMRQNMKTFYEEELPFLRLQEEYENLQANIQEHRVRNLVAKSKEAYIYAEAEKAEQESKNQTNKKRTLKKD